MSAESVKSVLIVDDDANIRLIIKISLEGLTDWALSQAASGKEALAWMNDNRPDLVLLDVMMPGLDGISVFDKIKDLFSDNLPSVIFMTAKVQSQEMERYKNLGAAGVIMKPFDPMLLAEQIKNILCAQ